MSFDKHYGRRKDRRKVYRGSKAIDKSCRNDGSCPWRTKDRKHKRIKQEMIAQQEIRDFLEQMKVIDQDREIQDSWEVGATEERILWMHKTS